MTQQPAAKRTSSRAALAPRQAASLVAAPPRAAAAPRTAAAAAAAAAAAPPPPPPPTFPSKVTRGEFASLRFFFEAVPQTQKLDLERMAARLHAKSVVFFKKGDFSHLVVPDKLLHVHTLREASLAKNPSKKLPVLSIQDAAHEKKIHFASLWSLKIWSVSEFLQHAKRLLNPSQPTTTTATAATKKKTTLEKTLEQEQLTKSNHQDSTRGFHALAGHFVLVEDAAQAYKPIGWKEYNLKEGDPALGGVSGSSGVRCVVGSWPVLCLENKGDFVGHAYMEADDPDDEPPAATGEAAAGDAPEIPGVGGAARRGGVTADNAVGGADTAANSVTALPADGSIQRTADAPVDKVTTRRKTPISVKSAAQTEDVDDSATDTCSEESDQEGSDQDENNDPTAAANPNKPHSDEEEDEDDENIPESGYQQPLPTINSNASGLNNTTSMRPCAEPVAQGKGMENLHRWTLMNRSVTVAVSAPIAAEPPAAAAAAASKKQRDKRRHKRRRVGPQGKNFYYRQGYCENCNEKYEHFIKHVKSARHQSWATDPTNFGTVDAFISSLSRPRRPQPPPPQPTAPPTSPPTLTTATSRITDPMILSDTEIVPPSVPVDQWSSCSAAKTPVPKPRALFPRETAGFGVAVPLPPPHLHHAHPRETTRAGGGAEAVRTPHKPQPLTEESSMPPDTPTNSTVAATTLLSVSRGGAGVYPPPLMLSMPVSRGMGATGPTTPIQIHRVNSFYGAGTRCGGGAVVAAAAVREVEEEAEGGGGCLFVVSREVEESGHQRLYGEDAEGGTSGAVHEVVGGGGAIKRRLRSHTVEGGGGMLVQERARVVLEGMGG
ncbi:hypothetical protein HDU98_001947, partial [Podochytrium sp. JEL0797]